MSQHKSNLPQEAPTLSTRGVDLWESWLSPVKQRQILEDIRTIVTKAPLLEPVTPSGKKMSVRMTSAGSLGAVVGISAQPGLLPSQFLSTRCSYGYASRPRRGRF